MPTEQELLKLLVDKLQQQTPNMEKSSQDISNNQNKISQKSTENNALQQLPLLPYTPKKQ